MLCYLFCLLSNSVVFLEIARIFYIWIVHDVSACFFFFSIFLRYSDYCLWRSGLSRSSIFCFVVVMWMEMYDYERCMEVNDAIQNILWMAHTKKAQPTHKFIKLLEKMPFYWRREMASVFFLGFFFCRCFCCWITCMRSSSLNSTMINK